MIFPDLTAHSKILQEVLTDHINTNEAFEAKDIAKRFGMDAMGSCTFGFEINTLKGNNKDFQDLVKNLMRVDWKRIVEIVVNKDILKFLGIRMTNRKIYEYVEKLINETIEYREKNNVKRNDIFQYVQQITDKDIGDYEIFRNRKLSRIQMILALQTFFLGGFETSSTVTSFAMLELARNQDVQDKLRKNIREHLSIHGELTYEALMSMDYLDWVINGKVQILFDNSNLFIHQNAICFKYFEVQMKFFRIFSILMPGCTFPPHRYILPSLYSSYSSSQPFQIKRLPTLEQGSSFVYTSSSRRIRHGLIVIKHRK